MHFSRPSLAGCPLNCLKCNTVLEKCDTNQCKPGFGRDSVSGACNSEYARNAKGLIINIHCATYQAGWYTRLPPRDAVELTRWVVQWMKLAVPPPPSTPLPSTPPPHPPPYPPPLTQGSLQWLHAFGYKPTFRCRMLRELRRLFGRLYCVHGLQDNERLRPQAGCHLQRYGGIPHDVTID